MGTNSLRVELFQGPHQCCTYKVLSNYYKPHTLPIMEFKHGGKTVKHMFHLDASAPAHY